MYLPSYLQPITQWPAETFTHTCVCWLFATIPENLLCAMFPYAVPQQPCCVNPPTVVLPVSLYQPQAFFDSTHTGPDTTVVFVEPPPGSHTYLRPQLPIAHSGQGICLPPALYYSLGSHPITYPPSPYCCLHLVSDAFCVVVLQHWYVSGTWSLHHLDLLTPHIALHAHTQDLAFPPVCPTILFV